MSPVLQSYHCLAPEQITTSVSPRSALAEPASDMWAAGVIAFVLLSGQWPVDADSPQLLQKKIKTGLWAFIPSDVWGGVSERAKSFLTTLMVANVAKRPAATQALSHPFLKLDALDKNALKPLARSKDICRSLRRISGWQAFKVELVHAIATHLSTAQLTDFQRHMCSLEQAGGKGSLQLSAFRRGLVQAGIQLPGRLAESLLEMASDDARTLSVQEVVDAAAERRQGLEETALWSLWSLLSPEGAATLRRAELLQLVDRGGGLLRQVFGPKASELDVVGGRGGEMPEFMKYEDLLARLRACAQDGVRSQGVRPAGWRGSLDLSIRLPPTPDAY